MGCIASHWAWSRGAGRYVHLLPSCPNAGTPWSSTGRGRVLQAGTDSSTCAASWCSGDTETLTEKLGGGSGSSDSKMPGNYLITRIGDQGFLRKSLLPAREGALGMSAGDRLIIHALGIGFPLHIFGNMSLTK